MIGLLLRDGARCDRSGPRWRETLAFHDTNPWVYERLAKMCVDLRARGFQRYSTRTLIAVLRFEWDLQSSGQEVRIDGEAREVKLNDHHTAYYARMIIEAHRELWDFFELRAAEGDPAGYVPPPCVQEVGQVRCATHDEIPDWSGEIVGYRGPTGWICPRGGLLQHAPRKAAETPPVLDGNQATLGI